MPWPVRALWQAATAEEQARAHATATTILRTWLGRVTREEAARELALSGVRFWQLSQQAVCGLVVGCLRQPRFRPRKGEGPPTQEATQGVGVLRERIRVLEGELEGSRRLIEVLRTLPGRSEPTAPSGAEGRRVGTRRRQRRRAGAAAERVAAPLAGAEVGDGHGA
jgi:hypothetical protein